MTTDLITDRHTSLLTHVVIFDPLRKTLGSILAFLLQPASSQIQPSLRIIWLDPKTQYQMLENSGRGGCIDATCLLQYHRLTRTVMERGRRRRRRRSMSYIFGMNVVKTSRIEQNHNVVMCAATSSFRPLTDCLTNERKQIGYPYSKDTMTFTCYPVAPT